MIKVTWNGKLIEIQEDKGMAIVHYGEIHVADADLKIALAKLEKALVK